MIPLAMAVLTACNSTEKVKEHTNGTLPHVTHATPAATGTTGATGNTATNAANNVVKITDTDTADKGELRVKLSEATKHAANPVDSIADGKVTVDLKQVANQGTSGGNGVNIALFADAKANNSDLFGEIVFAGGKAGEPAAIQYRQVGDMKLHPLDNYIVGHDLSVTVEWTNGIYSFKIDDKTDDSKSVSYDGSQLIDSVIKQAPVVVVAVKLGDKSKTTTDELFVDNFNIYQGLGDAAKLVFGDSFDDYPVGTVLNALPYNSNSNEAVVVTQTGTTASSQPAANTPAQPAQPANTTAQPAVAASGAGAMADDFESYANGDQPGGNWKVYVKDSAPGASAKVTNAKANGGSNSLLLTDKSTGDKPYVALPFVSDGTSGSISIDAYFPATNEKSTYINVGTDKSNAKRYIELKQTSNKLEYEAGDKDVKIADITNDQWYTINLSWTAAGTFSVTLNGKALPEATNVSQTKTGLAADVPTQLTIYTGDTSNATNTAYFDNLRSDLF